MMTNYDNMVKIISSQVQNIPQIQNSTNFWMFRSKQGTFYNEFINEKFIAIGWNAITESAIEQYKAEKLKDILKESKYADKVPQTAVNKCIRFIKQIKKGDIAIIVGGSEVTFVRIGDYYELNNEETTVQKELEIVKKIETETYVDYNCPYKKRRKIEIISASSVSLLPPALYKCIVSNRHGLSSLNEYADAVISAAYDIAYYDEKLIVKYHIGQRRDINPFDFSRFTLNVVKLITEDEKDVSGKYNVNSEGDIVLFLLNSGAPAFEFILKHLVPVIIINIALFGGKLGKLEMNAAMDKLLELAKEVLYRKENARIKKAEAEQAEANVEKTKAEIRKLNAETEEIILKNEMTKEIQKEMIEKEAKEILVQLVQASKPLQIKQHSDEVMEIVHKACEDLAS